MKTLFFFFIMTFVQVTSAQVDVSTLAIINSSDSAEAESVPAATPAVNSNRYTVRPRKRVPVPTPTPYKEIEAASGNDDSREELPEKTVSQATTLPNTVPPPKEESKDAIDTMRDFVMGGNPQTIEEYRAYLPPDDIRRNLFDISLAPFFVYNDSKSAFWYRNYNTFAPGFSIQTDVWFTPLFGVNTSFKRTVSGEIKNSPTTDAVTAYTQEWLSMGLRFRRFFGFTERVPSLLFGIDYTEYQTRVPSDDTGRTRIRTTAPRILLEAKMPKNNKYASIFGIEVYPWAVSQEIATGVSARSGSKDETYGFALYIGEEYKLARTSRIFWKLSYRLDKSLYSGGASMPDPVTGETLTNVSVTNSFSIFEFGYTWGK